MWSEAGVQTAEANIGQLQAKGVTDRLARPLGRPAHEAGPGMGLLRVRSALGEERVSLPLRSVHSEAPAS